MKHLSDEELYALSQSPGGGLPSHLRECQECSIGFHEFVALLESAAEAAGNPRPAPDLTDRVWAAIRPSLPVYDPKTQDRRSSGVFTAWPRGLVWAGALASLVLIGTSFWAGRWFEWRHRETSLALEAPPSQPVRVVLLVVREHLDRSERLLVELDHVGHFARVDGGPLTREAVDLLEDNRLYRQTVAMSRDPALARLLDRLDRVLVEVAHEPASLHGGDLAGMREQMNLDGLLFELRVVRDRHNKNEKETRL
jgi:hypothetical protein